MALKHSKHHIKSVNDRAKPYQTSRQKVFKTARNPETDAHPKTCRFHIKSFYKNQHFCIL